MDGTELHRPDRANRVIHTEVPTRGHLAWQTSLSSEESTVICGELMWISSVEETPARVALEPVVTNSVRWSEKNCSLAAVSKLGLV